MAIFALTTSHTVQQQFAGAVSWYLERSRLRGSGGGFWLAAPGAHVGRVNVSMSWLI